MIENNLAYYKGRPVAELTREELLEVISQLGGALRQKENSLNELHALMSDDFKELDRIHASAKSPKEIADA